MHNTEQNLSTALGELNCVSPHTPASLAELVALSTARDCIDELIHSCVHELRADPANTHTWSAIAESLRSSSASSIRQRYGPGLANAADEQVQAFWREFSARFIWDFLPTGFLHALYEDWMSDEFPADLALPKKAFTRRMQGAATASSGWFYTRCRVGSMMDAPEPLAARVPHWSKNESEALQYGLRRTGTTRGSAAAATDAAANNTAGTGTGTGNTAAGTDASPG